MTTRRLLLMTPVLPLIAACGGPPPPPVVDLLVKAGPDLNRNNEGTPLAVSVRLYSLNAQGRFESTNAYTLMERDKAVLGDESQGSEELVVRPGETRKMTLTPKPGVRFLGVAVLFRDIDRARWRAIAPVAASGPTKLVLTIGSNKAELASA